MLQHHLRLKQFQVKATVVLYSEWNRDSWTPGWTQTSVQRCCVWAHLKLGQRSLCTAQVCTLWRSLFKTTEHINNYIHSNNRFIFLLVRPLWTHTRHVNHSAVAVLQQVPGFTVNAAGSDAVLGEVFRVYGSGLAISPRRRKVLKLKEQTARFSSEYQHTGLQQMI